MVLVLVSTVLGLQSSNTLFEANYFYGGNGQHQELNTIEIGSGTGQGIATNRTGAAYREEDGVYYGIDDTSITVTITTTTAPTTTTLTPFKFTVGEYGQEWIKIQW